jgi:hypothetical protein
MNRPVTSALRFLLDGFRPDLPTGYDRRGQNVAFVALDHLRAVLKHDASDWKIYI